MAKKKPLEDTKVSKEREEAKVTKVTEEAVATVEAGENDGAGAAENTADAPVTEEPKENGAPVSVIVPTAGAFPLPERREYPADCPMTKHVQAQADMLLGDLNPYK